MLITALKQFSTSFPASEKYFPSPAGAIALMGLITALEAESTFLLFILMLLAGWILLFIDPPRFRKDETLARVAMAAIGMASGFELFALGIEVFSNLMISESRVFWLMLWPLFMMWVGGQSNRLLARLFPLIPAGIIAWVVMLCPLGVALLFGGFTSWFGMLSLTLLWMGVFAGLIRVNTLEKEGRNDWADVLPITMRVFTFRWW